MPGFGRFPYREAGCSSSDSVMQPVAGMRRKRLSFLEGKTDLGLLRLPSFVERRFVCASG